MRKTRHFVVFLQNRIFRCALQSKFHQTKATNKNKVKQDIFCCSCLALMILFYIQRERSQSQLSLIKRKQRVLSIIVLKNYGSCYSRSFESMMMVTGPSLMSDTCMSAPNTPRFTSLFISCSTSLQ